MQKNILLFAILFLGTFRSIAQLSGSEKGIDDLNRQIDHGVVSKDYALLKRLYANDFVFTHGTGVVDSKESWLKDIQTSSSRFISREHDSTKVEMHGEVAIITGTLTVLRKSSTNVTSTYWVRYVRVFALRKKQWQLISHRTVKEWHQTQ
jgi:ketosteroid isomerase-like protein